MPSILIADDNTNIQRMVTLAFEERGIKVVSVGNGEAAVRRLPDLNPDLVLADIFMPVRNGYEVCEFVKKDQRFSHVPVILLVGAFDPLDEKEARRVGADGVLKKPFVPPDPLIAMVMAVLEKNPRVVAELAKAKAALEPHALHEAEAPVHAAVPFQVQAEVPAKVEPRPLPEFPEPSLEEAALLYGFGKGRRTLEDEERATTNEPQEPVAEAEGVEEGFDASSTTTDWRRSAMDFEIPAEAANKPAFSSNEEELEPITFPSERDDTSCVVSAPEADEEVEAAPQDLSQHSAEMAAAQEPEVFSAEPAEAPAIAPEPIPNSESTVAPREPHWMDAMASSPVQQPEGGWMTALSEPQPRAELTPAEEPPAPPEPTTALVARSSDEEAFFEEEPAPSETASGPAWELPAEEAVAVSREPAENAAAVSDPEVIADSLEASASFREPELVVPPAVHVTPEPLLIDEDESQGPSDYGAQPHELTPLHAFQVPVAPISEETVAQESAGEETSAIESSEGEFDERVPTGPPPNREALAEIPFLTPPPGFDPNVRVETTPDSDAIDAVVQRVLERLEPQLHDLLAHGVLKPLVENLLQQELAKKEK
ncbi:MAG: response regulator [Candidatus Acidiferrales bacterium]